MPLELWLTWALIANILLILPVYRWSMQEHVSLARATAACQILILINCMLTVALIMVPK